MTPVDWAIVAVVFVLALWGFRRGLIVGAFGLSGLLIGGVLGSRLGPLLVEGGSSSPYAPLFTLLGALTLGALALSLAASLGEGIRRTLVRGPFSQVVDGIGGALLAAALALGLIQEASLAPEALGEAEAGLLLNSLDCRPLKLGADADEGQAAAEARELWQACLGLSPQRQP